MHRELGIFFRLTIPLLLGVLAPAPCEAEWYKGVTHVHSLWSDGDTAPEVIAAWYKERGYNFAAFSEHHVLQEGDKYFSIMPDSYLTPADVEEIKQQFDEDWVEIKQEGNSTRMRLKTHEELKKHFDEPGKFLLFPAEEITSLGGPHVNALNIREAIKGERGDYAVLIQHYIDQVNAQRQQYGLPMIAHVNHINFSDGVTTEELLKLHGLEFFEVYNGHPAVHNWGNAGKGMPATDRHWDVIESMNLLTQPDYLLYGVATDDSHEYKAWEVGKSNPGRGWIMVNADSLDTDALIRALQKGAFYASTGVLLDNIVSDGKSLSFTIQAKEGVQYKTQFIGTLKGFDSRSQPVLDTAGKPLPRASHTYSDEIGKVLAETGDTSPRYAFTGNELYVRAKIVSDKLQDNPFADGDLESAWVQPVLVK